MEGAGGWDRIGTKSAGLGVGVDEGLGGKTRAKGRGREEMKTGWERIRGCVRGYSSSVRGGGCGAEPTRVAPKAMERFGKTTTTTTAAAASAAAAVVAASASASAAAAAVAAAAAATAAGGSGRDVGAKKLTRQGRLTKYIEFKPRSLEDGGSGSGGNAGGNIDGGDGGDSGGGSGGGGGCIRSADGLPRRPLRRVRFLEGRW